MIYILLAGVTLLFAVAWFGERARSRFFEQCWEKRLEEVEYFETLSSKYFQMALDRTREATKYLGAIDDLKLEIERLERELEQAKRVL